MISSQNNPAPLLHLNGRMMIIATWFSPTLGVKENGIFKRELLQQFYWLIKLRGGGKNGCYLANSVLMWSDDVVWFVKIRTVFGPLINHFEMVAKIYLATKNSKQKVSTWWTLRTGPSQMIILAIGKNERHLPRQWSLWSAGFTENVTSIVTSTGAA